MQKRIHSILLPIKKSDSDLLLYMQKRSEANKVLPGYFGFWGGGAELGETPEQALLREVKEEMGLDINISEVKFFCYYEFLKSTKNIFVLEVSDGWENSIKIGEGDYRKWFSLTEALQNNKIIFEDKVVINDLERFYLGKSIK